MDETAKYKVERPIYSHKRLQNDFLEEERNVSVLDKLNCEKKFRRLSFKIILRYIFPFPFIMASFYKYKYIVDDIISGLTMFVFHIPQGMAFGLLGGLQPINGLYASLFPPLIYVLFGTSRHISIGTFSMMALLSSVPILREASVFVSKTNNQTFNSTSPDSMDYEMFKLQISIATTLLTGIIQFIMGLFQLGCIMNYVNDTLIGGFTTATAFHIVVSQLPEILGYKISRYSGLGELPYKVFLLAFNITKIHWVTILISIVCGVILLVVTLLVNPLIKKRFDVPLPIQLLLIIVGTLIGYYFSFASRYSVRIVGKIPKGFPMPMVPNVRYWPNIFVDAVILAIFGFITNSALVKMYCIEYSYEANFNQELLAYGLSNMFGSFFSCMISAAAISRSSVVTDCGMKSQLATLLSCLLMLFVILFLGPFFEHLPKVILSTIIVISLKNVLSQVIKLPHLYKFSKLDFDIWIVSFGATIFLNVPAGLVVGFIFSLLTVFMRFHNPKSQILGQLPRTNLYKNIKTFKDAIEIPGIKIFRYDAPIYFANADRFQEKLFKKCGKDPRKLTDVFEGLKASIYSKPMEVTPLLSIEENVKKYHSKDDVKFIILDLSSVNYVDNVAVRVLENIYKQYREIGVFIFLAEPNNRVIRLLSKSNFAKENFEETIFVTIHDAVLKALSMMMIIKDN